jgi:hypothetical protein
LLGTARLNGIDPERWLREVLSRIADHPLGRIEELLPWDLKMELDSERYIKSLSISLYRAKLCDQRADF